MGKLQYASTFRDLMVYKTARAIAQRVFEISKTFPKEEMFSLTDQVRRSSRSIGAQITEAWAKRRYERHFASKLTDADAEQQETQHWLETAADNGYLRREDLEELGGQLTQLGKMLNSMINKSASFCKETDSNDGELLITED